MLKLLDWRWDCGRQGSLEAMIVVDDQGAAVIDAMIATETEVHFGEVLGKHSAIYGTLETKEFSERAVGDDAATVDRVLSGGAPFPERGWRTIHGTNPLDFWWDEAMYEHPDGTTPLQALTREATDG